MNISSISSLTSATSTASSSDTSSLESQKASITQQIEQENSSKDEATIKQQKIQQLQAKLQQINAQIQQIQSQKNGGTGSSNKSVQAPQNKASEDLSQDPSKGNNVDELA